MCKYIKQIVTISFSIISVIFTFVPEKVFEIFILLDEYSTELNIIINRVLCFISIVILVTVVVILFSFFRWKVNIKGKNYKIKISYGNILKKRNCKIIIPFDECLSTSVGEAPHQIKSSSLCGQYLTENPIDDMQALVNNAGLKPISGGSKYKNQTRYESGRLIPNDNFLLLVFTKLDENGLGRMTRDEYLKCLNVLWEEIDKYYCQTDVCIPILGSGITRMDDISLTQQELLDLIIGSYKLSVCKIKSPAKLHIVCKKRDDFSLNKIGEYI